MVVSFNILCIFVVVDKKFNRDIITKNYRTLGRVTASVSTLREKDCAVALRSIYSQHLGFSSRSHVHRAGIYSTHITLRHHARYARNVLTEG